MKRNEQRLILAGVGLVAAFAFLKRTKDAAKFSDTTFPTSTSWPTYPPTPTTTYPTSATPPVAPPPPPPPPAVTPPAPPVVVTPPAAPVVTPPAPPVAAGGTGLDTAASAQWQKDEFASQAAQLAAKVASGQVQPGSAEYESAKDYIANLRGGVAQKGQGLADLAAMGLT